MRTRSILPSESSMRAATPNINPRRTRLSALSKALVDTVRDLTIQIASGELRNSRTTAGLLPAWEAILETLRFK
jgi:hypothetical protein